MEKENTIKAFALDLLCEVVGVEEETGWTLGLPYDEVLRRIHEKFPDAKTSMKCLHWYASQVRVETQGFEGRRLCQKRPRSKKEKT